MYKYLATGAISAIIGGLVGSYLQWRSDRDVVRSLEVALEKKTFNEFYTALSNSLEKEMHNHE